MKIKRARSAFRLVSNLGVLIGMVLLIIELNQNSTIAGVSAYQNLVSQVNHIYELQATNEILADIVQRGNTNAPLSELEQAQYLSYWRINLNSGRLAFKQYEAGLINENEMSGLLDPVRTFLQPKLGQSFWETESPNFSTRFREYVTDMMANRFPEKDYWSGPAQELIENKDLAEALRRPGE